MARCRVSLHVQDGQRVGLRVGGGVGASLSLGGVLYDRAADVWAGPYEVTPDTDGQTVPVHGLRMAQDLEVTAIPYLTTTNEAGGYTATIAS